MFGDWEWDDRRTELQRRRQDRWMDEGAERRLVIIELGAGTAVPTVRRYSAVVSVACKAPLIRINVREPEVRVGNIGLAMGALAGLKAIQAVLDLS